MISEDSKVSIIMPVFNAEKYLSEAIESVLHQTYKNWELLIINDGSTDGSKEKIRQYADDRIQYFEQQNQGVSVARNVGLQNMKGDFFCFLDADDILPENSLKSRLKIFGQSENIEFVDGEVDVYDLKLKKIKTWKPEFTGKPLYELLSLSGSCFFGITWMIKRKENKQYFFKEGLTHGEDLLFFMSISADGHYTAVEETIYQCREGNISAMSDFKSLENGYFKIYEELCKWPSLTHGQPACFFKKIKSIMFKSYLSKGQILNALKVLGR